MAKKKTAGTVKKKVRKRKPAEKKVAPAGNAT